MYTIDEDSYEILSASNDELASIRNPSNNFEDELVSSRNTSNNFEDELASIRNTSNNFEDENAFYKGVSHLDSSSSNKFATKPMAYHYDKRFGDIPSMLNSDPVVTSTIPVHSSIPSKENNFDDDSSYSGFDSSSNSAIRSHTIATSPNDFHDGNNSFWISDGNYIKGKNVQQNNVYPLKSELKHDAAEFVPVFGTANVPNAPNFISVEKNKAIAERVEDNFRNYNLENLSTSEKKGHVTFSVPDIKDQVEFSMNKPLALYLYNRFECLCSLDKDYGLIYGCKSLTIKVLSAVDKRVYVLRAIEGIGSEAVIQKDALEKWKDISINIGLVRIYDAHIEGDCLFFVEGYLVNSQSLAQRFIDNNAEFANEELLWSIICQILSAVQLVRLENSNFTMKRIHPHHILMLDNGKIVFNFLGIEDILKCKPFSNAVATLEEENAQILKSVAKTVLSIGCKFLVTDGDIFRSLSGFKKKYSMELVRFLFDTFHKPTVLEKVLHSAISNMSVYTGTLRNRNCELLRHVDVQNTSGRLLETLLNLENAIKIAEQYHMTFESYTLSLFRDYCYQLASESFQSNGDYSHMNDYLNKLEVGSMDQIFLSKGGSQGTIIASFDQIKLYINQALSLV